jgi:tRNA/tmRNA/rRNA uracil-C5-methylase (TrmA/RlmC/RlmD family)
MPATGSRTAVDRVPPVDGSCPHRPPCDGCPRYGAPGLAPATLARLATLAREHGLGAVPVVAGARTGFRLRARLAIRGRLGAPKLGLFAAGTHRLVHVPRCPIHHPLVNRVAEVVRGALVDARVPCWSDPAHQGIARYLQVVVERASQTAQVVLVANASDDAPLAQALDLVRDRLGSDLHSLWWNAQTRPTNTILGPDFHRWCGPDAVVERFGGPAIHYPPGAFGQSNLDVAERVIAHVRAQVPAGARVVELYAGVGAIGLSLLDRAGSLTLNELAPASLEGLALGCAALPDADRARVTVVPGAAGDCAAAVEGADVVIVDPPRKGLDAPLAAALGRAPPERLVYVSCGLDSLVRDVATLTSGTRLRLSGLEAFDQMPYTDHVETVARFERR